MFGLNDNNQQSNDDPAMLDNVKQLATQPADQFATSQSSTTGAYGASSPPPVNSTPQNSQTIGSASPDPTTQNTNDSSQSNDPPTSTAEPLHGFSMDVPNPEPPQEQNTNSTQNTEESTQTEASVDSTEPPQLGSFSAPTSTTQNEPPTPPAILTIGHPDPDHLAGLKQQALGHLEPLAEHLDGTPEETFKTTMMMIQANDNHTLLEKALEAAQKIEDDKVRAQAMLDIINEINYFSQDPNNNTEQLS